MSETTRCAFFGGPLADQIRVVPGDPERIEAPVPPVITVSLDSPSWEDAQLRTVTYRRDGIDDDGTRRYYPEAWH
jgi:hypothetical protein